MRKIRIIHPGPAVTTQELEAFERELKGRLSDDYKLFLQEHNGGPLDPVLAFAWKGRLEELHFFYPLLPDELDGLRRALAELRQLKRSAAARFLPIALTGNDYQVCLAYRGRDCGAVFVTDYRYRRLSCGDLVPIDVQMRRLASSFSEFLELLVEKEKPPEPECPIRRLGREGTPEELEEYLSQGNSIDAIGEDGKTIIRHAVAANNVAMVQACIAHGASLRGTIHEAVQFLQTDMIPLLVAAGADINERDENGYTPLHWVSGWGLPGGEGAERRRLREVVTALGGIDPENLSHVGELGSAEHFEEYVRQLGNVDFEDPFGSRLILEAIEHDNRPLLEACLRHGASLAGTIHKAVECKRPDLIKRLVEAGADINERNDLGLTPLYYACICSELPGKVGAQYRELRDLLLALGAIE